MSACATQNEPRSGPDLSGLTGLAPTPLYMLCAKYMYGSGQSVDCLAQSLDPQFAQ